MRASVYTTKGTEVGSKKWKMEFKLELIIRYKFEKFQNPEKGFTFPGHKYPEPCIPLEKEMEYDDRTQKKIEVLCQTKKKIK